MVLTSIVVRRDGHLTVLEHFLALVHQDAGEHDPDQHQQRDLGIREPRTVLLVAVRRMSGLLLMSVTIMAEFTTE